MGIRLVGSPITKKKEDIIKVKPPSKIRTVGKAKTTSTKKKTSSPIRTVGDPVTKKKEEPVPDVIRLKNKPKSDDKGVIAGLSTNITPGGIVGGVVAQAKRLVSEPKEEAIRIITGIGVGSVLGVAASAIIGTGIVATTEPAAITALNINSIRAGGSAYFAGNVAKAGIAGSQYATNTATVAATTSMLTKAGLSLGAAGILVSAIGSYPFAGFIQEEALQTLSLGIRSAIENGDFESAEEAIAFLEEILDPSVWDQIVAKIPYINVLNQLKTFREAATIKVAIDKKVVEDMRIQQETGESDDEKWKRIREEEEEADKAVIDYYNEQRRIIVEWENDAKLEAEKARGKVFEASAARTRTGELELAGQKQDIFEAGTAKTRAAQIKARNEDAAFWAKERAKQSQLEAEDRKAIADFWMAYRREVYKIQQDNRPSNLNFGLF